MKMIHLPTTQHRVKTVTETAMGTMNQEPTPISSLTMALNGKTVSTMA